jgi:hypothetical protein
VRRWANEECRSRQAIGLCLRGLVLAFGRHGDNIKMLWGFGRNRRGVVDQRLENVATVHNFCTIGFGARNYYRLLQLVFEV